MSEKKLIPTEVYAEMTPNPSTMKFVADRALIKDGEQVDYINAEVVKDSSPLAKELFCFPFVTGVFISANYITVSKNDSLGWEMVVQQLREHIRTWLMENEVAVSYVPSDLPVLEHAIPDAGPIEKSAEHKELLENAEPSEFDDQIRILLDEFVRPAVEQDGGAIDFRAFKDGKVYVELKGACNGCPSSMDTLKGGIEGLLKSKLEQVEEVVPV